MEEEPTSSISIRRAGNEGTLATQDSFALAIGKRKMRKTFG
jgi:hypothetical protein